MTSKVTYSDIVNRETDGENAANLVNDTKRAVNEVIDVVNGMGDVSEYNIGTGNGQIQLNSDNRDEFVAQTDFDNLGTASELNTGTNADEIQTNEQNRDEYISNSMVGTNFDQIPLNDDIVYPVDSVQSVDGLIGTQDDQQISLKGWHPNSDAGGGILYWDAAKPKSEHNGGTVFSPTVPFSATTSDYLDGIGETDLGGSGCWVRVDTKSLTPEVFGAVGDGFTDDTSSMQYALNNSEKVQMAARSYRVGALSGTRNALIGNSKETTSLVLDTASTDTLLNIDDLYISDVTLSDDGRVALDHSTGAGVFLVQSTIKFHAERCGFLTDRSVLYQVGSSLDARAIVHDCTLQRATTPHPTEADGMNFFTMVDVRVVDFDLLRTYGVMVGRSCINATFNQLSVGINNPVIARVENCRFAGLRASIAGNEVKLIFLQGYNSSVCHNSINDVFGRHIDLLGNYDNVSSNDTFNKSLISNNKIDYTLANQNIQANDNNEAGSIYCRYADVVISGNHSDFTNRLLISNSYDAISVRHGYKSAIIENNTIINPKACGINADVSDAIDTTEIHVSINNNVVLNHVSNSRNAIRVTNSAASKRFDSVTINDNTIDSVKPIGILVGNPTERSSDYTIESLSISGNWHKNQSRYDTVEFEGYPEYLHAPTLEVTVTADNSGSSSLGVMGNLLSAITCCEKYICERLTIELDSSVTTTQTITGTLLLSPIQSKELVFNGDNGAGGRLRFYSAGTQQINVSLTLDGNEVSFDTCIFNSDLGVSTTALLNLSGFGNVSLDNCEAQYGEYYIDTSGPSVNISGGSVDDINLGNSGVRAIININADKLVDVCLQDVTGVNNTRLYYANSPALIIYDNISVGTVAGVKTYTTIV